MSQQDLTPRLTLIILFFLIVIPAASGQTPCPAGSSTSYDRQYHNVGEVLVMPINLLPCQTVEVYESHDFNNNLNKGTVLVYSYYNEAGQELYTEFQNADRGRAWELLAEAVKAANSTEGFSGEDSQLILRLQTPGITSVRTNSLENFDLPAVFSTLTKDDYHRAAGLARNFEADSTRATALISIARAVLSDK